MKLKHMNQKISYLIGKIKRIGKVPSEDLELTLGYTGNERYIHFYALSCCLVINDGAEYNYVANLDNFIKRMREPGIRIMLGKFVFSNGNTTEKFGLILDRQTRRLYHGPHRYAQQIVRHQERVDNIPILDYLRL